MFFLTSWFIKIFYQPFINLLMGTYFLLEKLTQNEAGMGFALIIVTVLVRVFWLPISLASARSYSEQVKLSKKIQVLQKKYAYQPNSYKIACKQMLKKGQRVAIFSFINNGFLVIIGLMVWNLFRHGFAPENSDLLYKFMPSLSSPVNFHFLQNINLTKPSFSLNLILALVIFVYEVLQHLFSVLKSSSHDALQAQLALPIILILIFMFLPSGLALFIIISIIFSILVLLTKQAIFWSKKMDERFTKKFKKEEEKDKKTNDKEKN
jgi:YidC/Oxa1 family membrane protein insertase